MAFAIPHFITGTRFLVRANKERRLRINIMQVNDHNQAAEMIEKEQADAFAMDDVLLFSVIASRPDPKKFKVVGKF